MSEFTTAIALVCSISAFLSIVVWLVKGQPERHFLPFVFMGKDLLICISFGYVGINRLVTHPVHTNPVGLFIYSAALVLEILTIIGFWYFTRRRVS